MRLLLDNNLSSKLVHMLVEAGHEVAHVADHGMAAAGDRSVLAPVVEDGRVLVSADNFGSLLARTHATSPSFVLVRRVVGRRVAELAAVIADNLPVVEDDLEAAAVGVLGRHQPQDPRVPIA